MKLFGDLKLLLPVLESSDLKLRQHQIGGIETVIKWIEDGHGGIMAEEMGLGKTCQAVLTLALMAKVNPAAKFLIVCPLSVIEHWENELIRFGCDLLKLFVYKGYKEARENLRPEFSSTTWNVCLTTYNYFRTDEYYFDFPVEIVIVDEAHSVKSQTSQLHQVIRLKGSNFHLLLTGTPIQNDLFEFYSLLSLADNKVFRESDSARQKFFDLPRKDLEKKLKDATDKYVLRRLKSEVCKELPSSEEVILLHSLTNFQKQLYNAVLVSNHEFFKGTTAVKQSLMNVLAQLRKAVAHPYLFPGIEPEPFKEGEHLITSSGKYMVLDRLLAFLKPTKHRCLIFSQYARNLEILADTLSYRRYKYEYLDGSSKPEDRSQSIQNFQKPDSDVFCFLISTKAGGQGLTLTAADTVIFLDSDYNPQNDLQAAARCHRIGQDKPVKVIRLLAEHSVDNVIRKRAAGKLKLSDFILDDNSESVSSTALREVLLSDLAKLNEATDCTEAYSELLTDDYFISQIGKTDDNGHWMNESVEDASSKPVEKDEEEDEVNLFPRSSPLAIVTTEDENAFERIKAELENSDSIAKKAVKAETPLNDRTNKHHNPELDEIWKEQKAEKKAKREEQEKKRNEKKQKLWDENEYTSKSVTALGKTLDRQIEPEENGRFYRVVGDIAVPTRDTTDSSKEAWILHSVDSGDVVEKWLRGGLFSILDDHSSEISSVYKKADEMQDLHGGDAHFVESIVAERESISRKLEPKVDLDEDEEKTEAPEKLVQKVSVLLMVTQNLRNRKQLSLTESSLTRCFKAIADFALTRDGLPSIHMPCIWHGIPNLNEKMVRKLAVKGLCKKGIDVYCYRYKKNDISSDHDEVEVIEIRKPSKRLSSKASSRYSPQPPKKKRRIIVEDDDEDYHVSEEEEALDEEDEENDFHIDEDDDNEEPVGEMDDFIVDDDDEVEYDYAKSKSRQTPAKKTTATNKYDNRGRKPGSIVFSV